MQKKSFLILCFIGCLYFCSAQKRVVITGTIKNFYPANYSGKLGIPFFHYNPKSEIYKNYSPVFQSRDSFYYNFIIDSSGTYSIFFHHFYLIPGDSVHIDYLQKDNSGNLVDTFTNVFSGLGYNGNIGYKTFMRPAKLRTRKKLYSLRSKRNIEKVIDSAYTSLSNITERFMLKHNVSPDYKKIIKDELFFEKLDAKLKHYYGNSTKSLELIKKNAQFFTDNAINTIAYFGAIGDIPETLYALYHDPVRVLSELKKYLQNDTYNYASLIFANILQHQLPSYKNFYSTKIALNALNTTHDNDLTDFANFILNKRSNGKKINQVLKLVKVRDYFGKVTTIGEVLNKSESVIKFLDFWASWCGPCIEGIPYSMELPQKFGVRQIHAVFISIDGNLDNWRRASDKLGIKRIESYCILNKENFDALDTIMNIAPIPHYMLLDKSNNIQLLRAPEANKISREFLSSYLENKGKAKNSSLPPPPPPALKK